MIDLTTPLLAIDVGRGTQDILVYEPGRSIENSIKLVLPSPTVVTADRIRRATRAGRPIFLEGFLMGGGANTGAVRQHLAAGLPVYATPDAAGTLHDDPERVRSMGVDIRTNPDDAVTVHTPITWSQRSGRHSPFCVVPGERRGRSPGPRLLAAPEQPPHRFELMRSADAGD